MNMILGERIYNSVPGWVNTLINAVYKVIGPILLVVATAGIIYAIVVGVKFVRAEDKNEREEAKQKLIYVIVGIVVTAVLIALFYFLAYAIREGLITIPASWSNSEKTTEVIRFNRK